MRLLYVIAGAGGMECDMCQRDNALGRTLAAMGHEVLFVPLYTPLPREMAALASRRLFYGGINVFLQQKFPLFRRTPRLLDRLFDSHWLLNYVSRFGHLTQARDLAELTLSVLRGEEGHQRKELDELLAWLGGQPRPDAVVLPTSLLAGLARPIRQRLGAPVVCMLSGEDTFIDQFPAPYREDTLKELSRRTGDIDLFLAASAYYAGFMKDYLRLDRDVKIMTPGIDVAPYPAAQRTPPARYTIGFRSQICPANGLHLLAEAWYRLRADASLPPARLAVAGHLAPADREYFAKIKADVESWGLATDFAYAGDPGPVERVSFFQGLSVLAAPAVYPEPVGAFVPEALAVGVPVVLPRLGCFPEWVGSTGGGLLVQPNDPASLAEALARLMREPAEGEALGEAGRQAVRRDFNIRRVAESLLQATQTLLPAA